MVFTAVFVKSSQLYRSVALRKSTGISLAACFMLVSYLSYFYTLKMETTYSTETAVKFQRNA